MPRPLADRQKFMARYDQENAISDAWLEQLAFFVKVLAMGNVLAGSAT